MGNIKIHRMNQGGDDWFNLRAGSIGASTAKNVLVGGKGKTRLTYMYQLIAEQLTGKATSIPQSFAMKWGIETEPMARDYFELITGNNVEEVGLVTNSDFSGCHCSPDGLISDDSGLEIKCPQPATHVKYLHEGKVPKEYECQVQFSVLITGRRSWYFMSYHPDFEQQLILEVERDEKYISVLAEKLNVFLGDLIKTKQEIL